MGNPDYRSSILGFRVARTLCTEVLGPRGGYLRAMLMTWRYSTTTRQFSRTGGSISPPTSPVGDSACIRARR
jgi:hypothetical protein